MGSCLRTAHFNRLSLFFLKSCCDMNMNPENLDQRINLMKKKIKRLDYDHEILNQDNTQLNKLVSHASLRNQVRLAKLPHSDQALMLLSFACPVPHERVKLTMNSSKWCSAEILL